MTETAVQLTAHVRTPEQLALVVEVLGPAVVEFGAYGIAATITTSEETDRV